MGKVLKICCSKWENSSRDKRELSVYRELGDDVLVMAKGEPGDYYKQDCVDGFNVFRFSTRPLGERMPNILNRIISVFTWAKYVRELNVDIISGHDLFGILIGYLSSLGLGKDRQVKLIYDSHEFEIGRAAKRSKANLWLIKHIECFLMERCTFSIMVNDTIADEVQRIYNLKTRPIVVRSIPQYWDIDEVVIKQTRFDLLEGSDLPEDIFIIMYHGGIMKNRGIETLIELVSINFNIAGIILGNGQKDYLNYLQNLIKEKKIGDRIIFHHAVPIDELWKYVGAADVGMVMISNVCLNHYYSLPNKFFENIQSMTPIIGSNFPEIRRIVKQYKIGLTCNPDDIQEINQCIEKMRTDKKFYMQLKNNLLFAKQDLCWENEKKVLVKEYKKLLKLDENKL